MKLSDVENRIEEWWAPDYCKTEKERKCFFAGMATGAEEINMGNYDRLIAWIFKTRHKKKEA